MNKATKDLLEFWEDQMKLSHKSSNYFFRKSPSHYHMMLLVMTAYKLEQNLSVDELKTKLLRDYPDWQFLSQKELNRTTIELFFDLQVAKRFCAKEQKVIKVPNPNVFKIAAHILLARGISRIVCPDNLIIIRRRFVVNQNILNDFMLYLFD